MKDKKTLIIGLGGSGIKIINSIKRNYSQSDYTYLAIDLDRGHLNNNRLLSPSEIGDIGFSNHDFKKRTLKASANLIGLSGTAMTHLFSGINYGATQIRGIGRLAFLANYDSIKNLIQLKIEEINNHQDNQLGNFKNIQVVICFSICGSTGSGIFLDVANIVKEYLNERGQVTANILMPSLYQDFQACQMIFGNAYASMRELDFFMSWRGWHKESEYKLQMAENVFYKIYNHTSNGPFNNVNYYNNKDNDGRMYQVNDIIDIISTNIINNTERDILVTGDVGLYERCRTDYQNINKCPGLFDIDKRITQKIDDAKFELSSDYFKTF